VVVSDDIFTISLPMRLVMVASLLRRPKKVPILVQKWLVNDNEQLLGRKLDRRTMNESFGDKPLGRGGRDTVAEMVRAFCGGWIRFGKTKHVL
jgi:hypothetical protein